VCHQVQGWGGNWEAKGGDGRVPVRYEDRAGIGRSVKRRPWRPGITTPASTGGGGTKKRSPSK
jgi:hypothetical protein